MSQHYALITYCDRQNIWPEMSDNLNLQAKPMFSISLKPYEEENLAKEVVLTIGFEPEHPDAKDGIAKIFILDEEDVDAYNKTIRKEIKEWIGTDGVNKIVICYAPSSSKMRNSAIKSVTKLFHYRVLKENVKNDFSEYNLRVLHIRYSSRREAQLEMRERLIKAVKHHLLDIFTQKNTNLRNSMNLALSKAHHPGWNCQNYCIIVSKIATLYRSFGLVEESLDSLNQLEGQLASAIYEQGTFPSMSDQNEEIPTVDICNPDAKPYLHLVKSGEISLCDFCLYIFSNKLRLYKLLHQLENIIDSGLDILHSILRHISMKKSGSNPSSPYIWGYKACLNILSYCEDLEKGPGSLNSVYSEAYYRRKGDLYMFARYMLDVLGAKSGIYGRTLHYPCKEKDSLQIDITNIGYQLMDLKLLEAPVSVELYDRIYVEISEKAASNYRLACFYRSEASVKSDIANLHYCRKRYSFCIDIWEEILEEHKNMYLLYSDSILGALTDVISVVEDIRRRAKLLLSIIPFRHLNIQSDPRIGPTKNCRSDDIGPCNTFRDIIKISEDIDSDYIIHNSPMLQVNHMSLTNPINISEKAKLELKLLSLFCARLDFKSITLTLCDTVTAFECYFKIEHVGIDPEITTIVLCGDPIFTPGTYRLLKMVAELPNITFVCEGISGNLYSVRPSAVYIELKETIPPLLIYTQISSAEGTLLLKISSVFKHMHKINVLESDFIGDIVRICVKDTDAVYSDEKMKFTGGHVTLPRAPDGANIELLLGITNTANSVKKKRITLLFEFYNNENSFFVYEHNVYLLHNCISVEKSIIEAADRTMLYLDIVNTHEYPIEVQNIELVPPESLVVKELGTKANAPLAPGFRTRKLFLLDSSHFFQKFEGDLIELAFRIWLTCPLHEIESFLYEILAKNSVFITGYEHLVHMFAKEWVYSLSDGSILSTIGLKGLNPEPNSKKIDRLLMQASPESAEGARKTIKKFVETALSAIGTCVDNFRRKDASHLYSSYLSGSIYATFPMTKITSRLIHKKSLSSGGNPAKRYPLFLLKPEEFCLSVERKKENWHNSWNILHYKIDYDISCWLVQGEISGFIAIDLSSSEFPLVTLVFIPLKCGVYDFPRVILNRYDPKLNVVTQDKVDVVTNGHVVCVRSCAM